MTKDEALKIALDSLEFFKKEFDDGFIEWNVANQGVQAIKEALETKDEPVAWGMKKDGVILDVICPDEHEREEGEYTIPLYTAPQLQTKDKPVALQYPQKDIDWQREQQIKAQGSTTPQRTWVGLKDDDEIPWDGVDAKSFAKAIEAKLKQKNT
jgi:hypothetical protein